MKNQACHGVVLFGTTVIGSVFKLRFRSVLGQCRRPGRNNYCKKMLLMTWYFLTNLAYIVQFGHTVFFKVKRFPQLITECYADRLRNFLSHYFVTHLGRFVICHKLQPSAITKASFSTIKHKTVQHSYVKITERYVIDHKEK